MTGFDPKVYRNLKDGVGSPGDPANTDSTSPWTMVALLKGIWAKLNVGVTVAGVAQDATLVSTNTKLDTLHTDLGTVNLNTDTLETLTGIVTETAPATDTASSGLNGRLQRVAQRLTSLIAQVPATLGAKTAALSLSVTTATDDNTVALFGAVTETAPATDTASSGLNGRLQRIAQRITSLIALVPASLGQKAMSASFAVAVASDQSAIPTIISASAVTGGIATTARLPSAAASTNATLVKGSAGRIYNLCGKNNAAYDIFLVLYDSAASPPVPGSTTIRRKVVCPAAQAFVYDFPVGLTFATGIGYAFTKLVADADTTVLVAADITAFNLDYV